MTAFKHTHVGFPLPGLTRCVDTAITRSTRIPYEGVPHEPDVFLRHNSPLKFTSMVRHMDRMLKLRGQIGLELKHLDRSQRILWI